MLLCTGCSGSLAAVSLGCSCWCLRMVAFLRAALSSLILLGGGGGFSRGCKGGRRYSGAYVI